jgi:hypothetical protein
MYYKKNAVQYIYNDLELSSTFCCIWNHSDWLRKGLHPFITLEITQNHVQPQLIQGNIITETWDKWSIWWSYGNNTTSDIYKVFVTIYLVPERQSLNQLL